MSDKAFTSAVINFESMVELANEIDEKNSEKISGIMNKTLAEIVDMAAEVVGERPTPEGIAAIAHLLVSMGLSSAFEFLKYHGPGHKEALHQIGIGLAHMANETLDAIRQEVDEIGKEGLH